MDVEAFRDDVRKWLAVAKHPRWDRPYTELVYQPMIEVLNFINGYRTFSTFSPGDVRHGQEAGLDRRQHEGRLGSAC